MTPDHYLVIDFEATCCDQGSVPRDQMEIIEIGAVLVDAASLQPIDEFQSFVRPVRHPVLTPFCRQLTSITPEDVAQAPLFGAMLARLTTWLYRDASFVFGSWGDYDLNQLRQDCLFHHLPYPLGAPHLNLKRLMGERQSLTRKPGLGDALRLAGLEFEGTVHRGIDDARNIVRLLPYILGEERLPSAPGTDRRRR
ncbi:MAG: 3'-5' exonuclease [Pseudomonadota bacterium]